METTLTVQRPNEFTVGGKLGVFTTDTRWWKKWLFLPYWRYGRLPTREESLIVTEINGNTLTVRKG